MPTTPLLLYGHHVLAARWDGSEAVALAFMDEMAEMQGGNVADERKYGPTLWDYPQRKS